MSKRIADKPPVDKPVVDEPAPAPVDAPVVDEYTLRAIEERKARENA